MFNVVEFKWLCDVFGIKDEVVGSKLEIEKVEIFVCVFGGVIIVQKGGKDYILNGVIMLVDDLEGGKKRSGG